MVAETLQWNTGSLTTPMSSNHWTSPILSFWVLALCLHSAVSPVHSYWECPVLHCSNLITHWQLKLVPPASLGCQLSASPYWTLPGMHGLRKVFLGSCVTADAHGVPAVWENHAGTLPESLSASFRGSCVLGDTLILQMRALNSMVRERGCHQLRGVWTALVSLWAGGVPSRSESKDILRSGTLCSRLLWSLDCCFSLQCLGWIWFWYLAQLNRQALLPWLTLSCMIKS